MNRYHLYDRLCIEYPVLQSYKSRIAIEGDILVISGVPDDTISRVLDAINVNTGLFLQDGLKRDVGVILGSFTVDARVESGYIVSHENMFFKD